MHAPAICKPVTLLGREYSRGGGRPKTCLVDMPCNQQWPPQSTAAETVDPNSVLALIEFLQPNQVQLMSRLKFKRTHG